MDRKQRRRMSRDERRLYEYAKAQARPLAEYPPELQTLIRDCRADLSDDERVLLWDEGGSFSIYTFPSE